MSVEYSKLDPELQVKIKQWQANNPQNKSLTYLSGIADMLQNFLETYNGDKQEDEKEEKQKQAVLLDIRESLSAIASKEDMEMPDYAKPIVKALESLQKKLAEKEFNPIIKVDAPKVTVPTPIANVTVDTPSISTRGIENVIKKELASAFKEAIALIPPTEIPEPADRWDEVLEWLQSIDTASRLKPQPPTSMVVNGPLTNAELRSYPVEVTLPDTAPTLLAQLDQTDVLEEIETAVQTIAAARGIAADIRVTVLNTVPVTLGTLGNITSIGGLTATPMLQNTQNQTAILSNINNIV